MRPRQWEGRRSRGSVMSRRKQDCPWQSCKGQGGWVWWKLLGWAGRRVAAWLGGRPPQAAFPDGSKLRRPQEFHNLGNRLSEKSRRQGREGLARPSQGPPPCP